jgi:6-phosphogluconolactonase (cycloisomerase 2 family)
VYALAPDALRIFAYAVDLRGRLQQIGEPLLLAAKPSALAVAPNGAHLYLVSSAGGTLMTASIEATTGALAMVSTGTTDAPSDVLVHPRDTSVYVLNSGANTVSSYRRNPTSGALTLLGAVTTAAGPVKLALHPGGRFLYVACSGSVSTYSIAPDTGALTAVGSPLATAASSFLAISPSGRFLYGVDPATNTVSWFAIDAQTGALTATASKVVLTSVIDSIGSIALDPTGTRAYVRIRNLVGYFLSYDVNPRTGELMTDRVVPVLTRDNPSDIAFVGGPLP